MRRERSTNLFMDAEPLGATSSSAPATIDQIPSLVPRGGEEGCGRGGMVPVGLVDGGVVAWLVGPGGADPKSRLFRVRGRSRWMSVVPRLPSRAPRRRWRPRPPRGRDGCSGSGDSFRPVSPASGSCVAASAPEPTYASIAKPPSRTQSPSRPRLPDHHQDDQADDRAIDGGARTLPLSTRPLASAPASGTPSLDAVANGFGCHRGTGRRPSGCYAAFPRQPVRPIADTQSACSPAGTVIGVRLTLRPVDASRCGYLPRVAGPCGRGSPRSLSMALSMNPVVGWRFEPTPAGPPGALTRV